MPSARSVRRSHFRRLGFVVDGFVISSPLFDALSAFVASATTFDVSVAMVLLSLLLIVVPKYRFRVVAL